jgi:hypothetical protein
MRPAGLQRGIVRVSCIDRPGERIVSFASSTSLEADRSERTCNARGTDAYTLQRP